MCSIWLFQSLPHKAMNTEKKTVALLSNRQVALEQTQLIESRQYVHRLSHIGHIVQLPMVGLSHISELLKEGFSKKDIKKITKFLFQSVREQYQCNKNQEISLCMIYKADCHKGLQLFPVLYVQFSFEKWFKFRRFCISNENDFFHKQL